MKYHLIFGLSMLTLTTQ